MPVLESYNRLAIHYSACNDVYYKSQECEKEYPVQRVIGKCSQYFVQLLKCIQSERQIQRLANNKKAKEKHARIQQRLAELEETNAQNS